MPEQDVHEFQTHALSRLARLLLAALDSVGRTRVEWRRTVLETLGHEPKPPAEPPDHSRFDSVAELVADVFRVFLVCQFSGLAALLTFVFAPDIFEACLRGAACCALPFAWPLQLLILARMVCRRFHRFRVSTYVLWPAELFWLVWFVFILCAPICV